MDFSLTMRPIHLRKEIMSSYNLYLAEHTYSGGIHNRSFMWGYIENNNTVLAPAYLWIDRDRLISESRCHVDYSTKFGSLKV